MPKLDGKHIYFNGIAPFDYKICHTSNFWDEQCNVNESHMHEECEIYVNVTGDVSFMVEGTEYSVSHGDAVISRPYEYHHCVYKSDARHEHYWMLFSPLGNESLLGAFYNREAGKNNLIKPPEDDPEALIKLCRELIASRTAECGRYAAFIKLIDYIGRGFSKDMIDAPANKELGEALKIIDSEYGNRLDVSGLARRLNLSVNTLERYFKRHFSMTPHEYIVKRRLAASARLLKTTNMTVLSIAVECGWSDCSYFIGQFKRYYGVTPAEFKQKY